MCNYTHKLCQYDLRENSKYEINQHYFEFVRNATKEEREANGWDSKNTRGLYKCRICGKEHFYKKSSFKIELKTCENNCNGFGRGTGKIVIGVNNLAITDPNKMNILVNKDDGYKFSRGSHNKVLIECPICKNNRYISLNNLIDSDGKCKQCIAKERYENMTEEEQKKLIAKLSEGTKQYMSNLTEEELAIRADKRAKTIANKTDEEKQETSKKRSERAKSIFLSI